MDGRGGVVLHVDGAQGGDQQQEEAKKEPVPGGAGPGSGSDPASPTAPASAPVPDSAPSLQNAQPAEVEAAKALPDVESSSLRRVAVAGDPVVVVMNDGQRLEGVLTSSDEASYTVRIAGVDARLERSEVERVFVQDTPLTRYKRMRGMIASDDTERLVLLVQWLQSNRLYAEALKEVDQVLAVDPNHGEGLRLKALILELVALQKRAAPSDEQVEERDRNERTAKQFPKRPTPLEFPFLTADQIALMKVFEVDLRDPPRLVIPPEVVERLLTDYSDSPLVPGDREGREAFKRLPPEKILDVMFRLRARDLYAQVEVTEQPASMKVFRDQIHAAWLVNNCATTRCHGGSAAGRLQLSNWRPTSDESVYTNFLILERFRTKEGQPLIDYEEPERSVLLQMGLPREDARTPHPSIPGWSPVFRTRDNRRFQQAVAWIGMLYRPRPDYPIQYVPPGDREVQPPPGEVPPANEPVER